ncbi:MAG: mechanosensitive ion channel domain-containing protein [Halobacterium sp.]
MQPESPSSLAELLERTVDEFLGSIAAGIPKVLTGIVFLVLAAVVIKVAVTVVRVALRRVYPDQPIYVQLGATLVTVLLWFGAILGFLSAVGLPEIAAALGTASGFLALGVSYALSGMLEDAVAGIYLLRDPDFNPGDTVESDGTTAVVDTIELRKTRLDVGDDRLVRANADIEDEWTKISTETVSDAS